LIDQALGFVEQVHLPVAVTLLDKSAVPENHPCFIGVYAGHMGRADVADYVESSDCVVLLGSLLTDINLGLFTAHLNPGCTIHATRDRIAVGHRSYDGVRFPDFVAALAATDLPSRPPAADLPRPISFGDGWTARPGERITVARLFERLASFMREETIVIADPGDALFAAADLPVRQCREFLSPAYYASLGFAVPAAIGAQLANPDLRPLVLVGDGAFQMTGLELSTVARYGLNPIVVVLNNGGYTTERLILDGGFNDILPWAYHRLPETLGAGRGYLVEMEDDLDRALAAAETDRSTFALLDVHLDRLDVSPALRRLAAELNRAVTSRA
jgi:indolepyruvate decarboxylase